VRGLTIVFFLATVIGCAGSEAPPEGANAGSGLFKDVTEGAGIDFIHDHGGIGEKWVPETMSAGACVLDFDNDGLLDIYLVQSGRLFDEQAPGLVNRLYRNLGDWHFEDVTSSSGTGDGAYGFGAIAADYDGDGDTDLYLTNYGPNTLLRNEGDGTFSKVTESAGVGNPLWSTSAAFFDADGDGDLDLYVVNYVDFSLDNHRVCGDFEREIFSYCHPDCYPTQSDTFYRNLGDGTFEDATLDAGLEEDTGKGLGVVVADFDNDSDPDIYVANDSTPNFLWVNDGTGHFTEQGLVSGAAFNDAGRTQAGMGVDAGDINNDGWLDVIVTHLSMEDNALYLGGPNGFSYGTGSAGLYTASLPVLGFGANFFDADLDGDLDLFVANGDVVDTIDLLRPGATHAQPDQLFLNDGSGRFALLDPEAAGGFSQPRVSRASITADLDNDGRMDLLVTTNNGPARLFRNRGQSNHWIGLELRGPQNNPKAIGARISLVVGDRTIFQEVRTGSGYLASSDSRIVFGLGPEAPSNQSITIRWPSGRTTRLHDLEINRYHLIDAPPEQVLFPPQE